MFTYTATVVRWVDGDTVDLDADLGFKMTLRDRFRLYGIDTPERRPKKSDFTTDEARREEIKKADAALAYCEKLAPAGTKLIVRTFKDEQGKYGRWLADLHLPTEQRTLNEMLVAEGHAKLASY
jgi:micrococcal nuclease